MSKLSLVAAVAACLALGACADRESSEPAAPDAPAPTKSQAPAPTPPAATPAPAAPPSVDIPADTVATAFGKGTFERPDGTVVTFEFDANFSKTGGVSGRVEYAWFEGNEKMDVKGRLTCGHFDLESHRAWLGGEVDVNRSTLAKFQTERYNTGAPLWFRMEEAADPTSQGKVSELRFGGDDNIADAAAFCESKSWMAGGGGLYPIAPPGAVIIFALPEAAGG